MRVRAELIVESDGKEVFRGESKSFLLNFCKVLYSMLATTGSATGGVTGVISSATVTDTSGYSQTAYAEWYSPGSTTCGGGTPAGMNAPDNDDSFGIVVGSGSASVSPTDYRLVSKISHGTGSGQLDHDTHATTTSFSSTSSYIELARTFVNRSSGDVVVREVGIMARSFWKNSGSVIGNDVKYLIARDVLPSPVTVKPLGVLVVRYRITLTT
jgi:hypothetical protein